MSTYIPDAWVIVNMTSPKYGKISKILAGWYGGYLGSNSWKFSSGIEKIEQDGDMFIITNHSGSVYKCHKGIERFTVMTSGVYQTLLAQVDELNDGSFIEVVDMKDFKLEPLPKD